MIPPFGMVNVAGQCLRQAESAGAEVCPLRERFWWQCGKAQPVLKGLYPCINHLVCCITLAVLSEERIIIVLVLYFVEGGQRADGPGFLPEDPAQAPGIQRQAGMRRPCHCDVVLVHWQDCRLPVLVRPGSSCVDDVHFVIRLHRPHTSGERLLDGRVDGLLASLWAGWLF